MSLGNNLTSGGDNFNIVEQVTDKIFEMINTIIREKSDDIVHLMIGPQIAEQMKSIFESYPVQLEASKMFNRELFPIYKQTLEDFANFNSLVKDADQDIDKAINKYANEIIANKDNDDKKNEAKQGLLAALKGISVAKVGDVLSMKGGDLKSFLGNVNNKFKPNEGGTPSPNYLSVGTKPISNALEQILTGMKGNYEEKNTKIKNLKKDYDNFNNKRRTQNSKINIAQSLGNEAIGVFAGMGDKAIGALDDKGNNAIGALANKATDTLANKENNVIGALANKATDMLANKGNKATDTLANKGNNVIGALANEAIGALANKATGIKLYGGKSKRRKPRKRIKTYKKRR